MLLHHVAVNNDQRIDVVILVMMIRTTVMMIIELGRPFSPGFIRGPPRSHTPAFECLMMPCKRTFNIISFIYTQNVEYFQNCLIKWMGFKLIALHFDAVLDWVST